MSSDGIRDSLGSATRESAYMDRTPIRRSAQAGVL
jgi:hypothetical protein